MHQIVLLTAMSATAGLFGGGRQCTTGQCGAGYQAYRYPAPAVAAPQYPAYQVAPRAPVATAQPTTYYQSSYSYPTAAACPTGTCPRR